MARQRVRHTCAAVTMLGLLALGQSAHAAVITFSVAPAGAYEVFDFSENGFRYVLSSGELYVNDRGNPGRDMEGSVAGGGGILEILATDESSFAFQGLDYSAFNVTGLGSQTLVVRGFVDRVETGAVMFELANSNDYGTPNWTLVGPGSLAGVSINRMTIQLNAGYSFLQAVDNVRLSPVAVIPEPGSWALMIGGFGAAGAMLRRRRTTPPAPRSASY